MKKTEAERIAGLEEKARFWYEQYRYAAQKLELVRKQRNDISNALQAVSWRMGGMS